MYKPSEKVLEYTGHQLLKRRGCIAISHLHYLVLKSAEYYREHCFFDILWPYVCLLISLCHIQLGAEVSLCYIMTYCEDTNLFSGITLAHHLFYDESATGRLASSWSLHIIYYASPSMLSHVGIGLLQSFTC